LMPIGVDYLRKKYDVPEPAEGEETTEDLKPEPPTPFGGGGVNDAENPTEDKSPTEEADVKAGAGFDPNQPRDTHGKWTASSVASHLEKSGVPISRLSKKDPKTGKKITRSGVKVFEMRDASGRKHIFLEHNVWPSSTEAVDRQMLIHQTKTELNKAGLDLTEHKPYGTGSGIYRVHRKAVATPNEQDPAKAGDQPGHPFRGNQWTDADGFKFAQQPNGIYSVHHKGFKIGNAFTEQHAIKLAADWKALPEHERARFKLKHGFPSISQSAEDERRHLLQAKLDKLNDIEDDAVFASELSKLAGELK